MTPTFSILHPTIRPDKSGGKPFDYDRDARHWQEWGWSAAVQTWAKRADRPKDIEYILCVDEGWEGALPIVGQAQHFRDTIHLTRVVNHSLFNAITAWNVAAVNSHGKILIASADDFFPPDHWDTELLKVIPDLDGEFIIETRSGTCQDREENRLIVLSILSRKRYERFGWVFYPEYAQMGADCDFTYFARKDNIVIDARHLLFQHLHAITKMVPWDAVYRRGNSPANYELGRRVYAERIKGDNRG